MKKYGWSTMKGVVMGTMLEDAEERYYLWLEEQESRKKATEEEIKK